MVTITALQVSSTVERTKEKETRTVVHRDRSGS